MSTLNPTTAAEIITAVNTTAVAGDVVLIPAGNFDCRATPLAPAAGVTIQGSGKGVTIIQGCIQKDLGGSLLVTPIKSLTIDSTGIAMASIYAPNELADGIWAIEDCRFTGTDASGAAVLTFVAKDGPCVGRMLRTCVDTAAHDCISTKAPGGAAIALASKLDLIDCEAYGAGAGATDQCLTAHEGFAVDDWNGYYHGAQAGQTIAPDAPTTRIRLYGTRVYHEGTNFTVANCDIAEGCQFTTSNPGAYVYGYTRIKGCISRTGVQLGVQAGGTPTIEHNIVIGSAIRITAAGTPVVIRENLVCDNTATNAGGIWLDSQCNNTYTIVDNLVTNCYRNVFANQTGSPTVNLTGNLIYSPTSKSVYSAAAGVTWAGGYNVVNGSLANYTAQAGDSTTAPTAAQVTEFLNRLLKRPEFVKSAAAIADRLSVVGRRPVGSQFWGFKQAASTGMAGIGLGLG